MKVKLQMPPKGLTRVHSFQKKKNLEISRFFTVFETNASLINQLVRNVRNKLCLLSVAAQILRLS